MFTISPAGRLRREDREIAYALEIMRLRLRIGRHGSSPEIPSRKRIKRMSATLAFGVTALKHPVQPRHPSEVLHDHYDRGASGHASKARPAGFHSPEGKSRGSIRTERVEVVQYQDVCLFDRMHKRSQLSDMQHEAAEKLAKIWTAAGLNPTVSADLGAVPEPSSIEEMIEEADVDADDESTALDRYRRLMRQMPDAYPPRLESLLQDRHPGLDLPRLQEALDWLVKYWKITDGDER